MFHNKSKSLVFLVASGCIIVVVAILIVSFVMQSKNREIEMQLTALLEPTDTDSKTEHSELSIAEQIYQNMHFEVIKVNDTSFSITVTAPNLDALFFSIFDPNDYKISSSMEEYQETINTLLGYIKHKLSAGEYEYITQTIDVPLSEDGSVELTYDLADALYGGLLSLQQKLLNNYMETTAYDE